MNIQSSEGAGNRATLVGVVSWSWGCAAPYFPGVYADVSYLVDWIYESVNASMNGHIYQDFISSFFHVEFENEKCYDYLHQRSLLPNITDSFMKNTTENIPEHTTENTFEHTTEIFPEYATENAPDYSTEQNLECASGFFIAGVCSSAESRLTFMIHFPMILAALFLTYLMKP